MSWNPVHLLFSDELVWYLRSCGKRLDILLDIVHFMPRFYIPLWSYQWFFGYPKPPVLVSQIQDKRPHNNPIQGRCY